MSIASSIVERIAPPLWRYQPQWEINGGNYQVRLVRNAAELDAALRLRFEVFNLELGEGLATSYLMGRDQDQFEARCKNLIAEYRNTGAIIGTYRLQTLATAGDADGFYTAAEFELGKLPFSFLDQSVEIGRACIALPHRNTQVLLLLWQGLLKFLTTEEKRYFFGCCSLTSQNEREGLGLYQSLSGQSHIHPSLHVEPKPGYECQEENGDEPAREPSLPKLFRAYLRFGAKVCGPPAIDRQFRTIDYFVVCDTDELTQEKHRLLTS
jgi:putative hemolysin